MVSALVAIVIAATAAAQPVTPPTSPPGSGGQTPPPAEKKCVGKSTNVTVNPYVPVGGDNFHKISDALCRVKPNGTIIITHDRTKPYAEKIEILKPGLTISAAELMQGGIIELRPPAGTCIVVRPWDPHPMDPDRTAVTTIEGFIIVAPETTDGKTLPACVDVRFGMLNLRHARIDMTASDAQAVHIHATGALSFEGAYPAYHGVFRRAGAETGARRGDGVLADQSLSVALTNIRIEGLRTGLVSRSRTNALKGVQFINNDIAVYVADEAIVAHYAPGLTVESGRFEDNGDAVLLGVGPLETGAAVGEYRMAFKGPINIGREESDASVTFVGNQRGLGFIGAYPEQALTIRRASFVGNTQHALQLHLPDATSTTISDATFTANGAAIALDGALDGDLTLTGATSLSGGANPAIEIENGSGVFSAQLLTLSGTPPALRFGAGFFKSGRGVDVTIAGNAKPDLIAVSKATSFCTLDISDKKGREAFANRLNTLKIKIGGKQIAQHFSKKGGELKESELEAAQTTLCR